MQIPPENECINMLCHIEMPPHIQAHSRLVCQVAMAVADGLIAAGITVNRKLVCASALLHDITKPRSFETGENHAQTGGEHLTELGFPEVGNIIRQHVMLDDYPERNHPTEAEVVNYADKRVLHDKVVSLDERMGYILKRYAKTKARRELLKTLWQQTRQLEARIFSYLAFTPEMLEAQMPPK